MRKNNNKKFTIASNTKKLVLLAILTAIVIIFQLLGSFIKFGAFSISLVLIPIVIGAALYGPLAGAWLGFVFGATVLLSGDAALFLGYTVFGTIVTVLVKGIACGLVAGVTYNALKNKNKILASYLCSAVCPIVNTAVFIIGCYTFFLEDLRKNAADFGQPDVTSVIFLAFIGGNFIFELAVNILLSPAVIRILKIKK